MTKLHYIARKTWVVALSAAGLLPFAAFTLATALGEPSFLFPFMLYSLAITCFLAGSGWGISLAKMPVNAGILIAPIVSNALVLLSVIALWQGNKTIFLLNQIVVFLILLIGEHILRPFTQAPPYYRHMRLWVTLTVIVIHVLQLLFSL